MMGENENRTGFEDEILKNFDFLINEYGFRCVKTEITSVRYESDKIFVSFYYERYSFEVGFQVGFINKDKSKEVNYSLPEIMRLYGDKNYLPYQITKSEVMSDLIPKMAELIKQYAIKAILGDNEFYQKLKEVRSEWFKEFMISQRLPKADVAWKNKNYKEFIEIVKPYINDLQESYKKKLEYAIKKVKT